MNIKTFGALALSTLAVEGCGPENDICNALDPNITCSDPCEVLESGEGVPVAGRVENTDEVLAACHEIAENLGLAATQDCDQILAELVDKNGGKANPIDFPTQCVGRAIYCVNPDTEAQTGFLCSDVTEISGDDLDKLIQRAGECFSAEFCPVEE